MWRCAGSRPMRPLDTVILDAGLKDAIIKDCQDFLASKDWYMKRGPLWPSLHSFDDLNVSVQVFHSVEVISW